MLTTTTMATPLTTKNNSKPHLPKQVRFFFARRRRKCDKKQICNCAPIHTVL
jgi:hypothetical protein